MARKSRRYDEALLDLPPPSVASREPLAVIMARIRELLALASQLVEGSGPPALKPPVGHRWVSLHEAARLFGPGRLDRPRSPSTVLRWVKDGYACPDGQVVRLEAVRVGSVYRTTKAAVRRFTAAVTASALAAGDGGGTRDRTGRHNPGRARVRAFGGRFAAPKSANGRSATR